MPSYINLLKTSATEAKTQLEATLRKKLADAHLENFIADELGYYTVVASDNAMVQNCKVLLNIFTAASEFSGSAFDLLRLWQVNNLRKQIDAAAFKQIFSVFSTLFDDCPEMFKLVANNVLQPLVEGKDDPKAVEAYDRAIAASITNKADKSAFSIVLTPLKTLKNLEDADVTSKSAPKNHSNALFTHTQNQIIGYVKNNYDAAQQATFIINDAGEYFIFDDDDISIKNIKYVLNALIGLAKLYHSWNQLSKSGTGILAISTLAEMYSSFRTMQTGFKQLMSKQNMKEIATDLNDIIREVLVEFNPLMEKIVCTLDQLEDTLGFRAGTMVEQFQPTIDAYVKAAEIMQPDFKQAETYPYWATRIKNLEDENKITQKSAVKTTINIKVLQTLQNIFNKHGTDPLSSYSLDELQTIRRKLHFLKLDKPTQKNYSDYLDAEIANKEKPANSSNWGIVNTANHLVEQAGNYAGMTLHSVAARQLTEQLNFWQAEKSKLEQQVKLTNSHIQTLKIEQEKTPQLLIVKKAEPKAAPVTLDAEEKLANNPKISKRDKKLLANVFGLLRDVLKDLFKPKYIELPIVKEVAADGAPVIEEKLKKRKGPHLPVVRKFKKAKIEFALRNEADPASRDNLESQTLSNPSKLTCNRP